MYLLAVVSQNTLKGLFMNSKFVSSLLILFLALFNSALFGVEGYRVNGKSVDVDKLYKQNTGKFYELEKQKYELIENIAKQAYLESFFEEMGRKQKVSPEVARANFLDSTAKVSQAEIKATLKKFGDHPKLKSQSDAEKKRQITDYLKSNKEREAIDKIIREGLAAKKLVITYPKPQEPIFPMKILATDPVKYGPKSQDTKPVKCKGEDCAITVVEYSEYQCPFCVRVLPAVDRLLSEYAGKVRWIVRDFPLGFHDRAKPAAIAARCAQDQGKYWEMYATLFENQRKLADADLRKYGEMIKLDKKALKEYLECLDKPAKHAKHLETIDKNYALGESVGVTGTPAFFINGRRLSGALPYEKFKEIFEDEIAKLKKSKTN